MQRWPSTDMKAGRSQNGFVGGSASSIDHASKAYRQQHARQPLEQLHARLTIAFVDRINSVTVATINLSICGRAPRHRLKGLAAYEDRWSEIKVSIAGADVMKRLPGTRHFRPKAIGLSHAPPPRPPDFQGRTGAADRGVYPLACPRSRPSLRNGRFPASILTAVLPRGGHERTVEVVVQFS
jgi:hypothetical protein